MASVGPLEDSAGGEKVGRGWECVLGGGLVSYYCCNTLLQNLVTLKQCKF